MMTIDQMQWWLAAGNFVLTLILRVWGGDWHFAAFLTLVAVGLMAA